MISNYFTLLHASRLLNDRLRGARIREIYTQEKRRLCLTCADTSVTTIVLSCVPAENSVYAIDARSRARQNAADLFPESIGKEIRAVECDGMDRILHVAFTDGSLLRAEFFGVRANILAYASDGRLTDCFLHGSDLLAPGAGVPLRPLAPALRREDAARITGSPEQFLSGLRSGSKHTALAAFKAAVPKLGAVLCEEFLVRAGIDPESAILRAPDENLQRLYDIALQSVGDLLDYTMRHQPRIYWDGPRAVCFSILSLESKRQFTEERFDDLSEAVRRYISAGRSRESFGAEKEVIRAWMARERARSERTLGKMDEDARTHDRAETYECCGTLLMASLHRISKGMTSVVLEDFTSGEPVAIALDPSLAPAANAERYYQKAKHARAAALEARERRAALARHIGALAPLMEELEQADTREAVKAFHRRYGAQLKQLGYMTETEREQLPPFRIFTVEGGFQVLAGKSSENNDLLTTKYAKPNDLWFHARGSSGSHVVLKVGSASGDPTKKAIQQAASIAAYYSKMKNASAVPVAMTEKKFVHKPKGVPAGTVTLDREKVIFVEPKLPDTAPHT